MHRPALHTGTAVAAVALGAALLIPFAAGGSVGASVVPTVTPRTPAATKPDPKCAKNPLLCAKVGDVVEVKLGDLKPTQPSLGYDEVYYKLGRYTKGKDKLNKKFGDWCEAAGLDDVKSADANSTLSDPKSFTCTLEVGKETDTSKKSMKSVVIGPEGKPYLTDGHHTLTSFYEMPDGGPKTRVRLLVLGNLSALKKDAFWTEMKKNKWTWLQDVNGKDIKPTTLPAKLSLKNFSDDRLRGLLYFARDIGYAAGTIPFQEFYWAAWLRDAKPAYLTTWNRDDLNSYLATVKSLAEAQVALKPDAVVNGGFTAMQLGQLAKFDEKGEMKKLSKSFSDDKPGKIAYLLEYKKTLAKPGKK